ncbi:hypothetical protein LINGRAHAP2_LOCUS7828 [Linum grandiflorum]
MAQSQRRKRSTRSIISKAITITMILYHQVLSPCFNFVSHLDVETVAMQPIKQKPRRKKTLGPSTRII